MSRQPFSRPIQVRALPAGGLARDIEASAEERAAIARFLAVPAVEHLRASFSLRPWGEDGAAVTGRIAAKVVQDCVVTLEPVEQEIDEAVDLRFSPEPRDGEAADPIVDPDAEEPPDLLVGGQVDLGAITVEHLALGLDPNPRKPGAVFDAEAAGVAAPREPPLAALAGWKPRDSGKG